MYMKSIILTQNKRYDRIIRKYVNDRGREVLTELPLLSDIEAIKADIATNRTTVSIRGEFGHFVKTYGLPYMLMIDYLMDLDLTPDEDPDNRKLMRTFLLAYTILAKAKGYGEGTANIVFIIDKKFSSAICEYAKHPLFLLDQIRTRDDKINAMIDSFASEEEKVKKYFRISYIHQLNTGQYSEELDRLGKIMDGYDRIVSSRQNQDTKVQTEMLHEDAGTAEVICRATVEKIIVDGELRQISEEEKEKFLEKDIHLSGALTQITMPAVLDHILTTFTSMAKINPFKKTEKILIHVPDRTLIDGSFASSLGLFLANALSEYTGISINIGRNNLLKAKGSSGFFAIKDFIYKNL